MQLAIPFRIEKRIQESRSRQFAALGLSMLGSLLVSGALIHFAGADILEGFYALFSGALGDQKALINTLLKSTPLLLTSQAAALAFRGNIWNIGLEGQLFAGAMAGYWAYASGLPLNSPIFFLIAGFLGGAIWGWIPGILKAKFNVDEIIGSVMLNYVASYLLSFLLTSVWQQPDSFYHQTELISTEAHLPLLVQQPPLHVGFLLALGASILVYVLIRWTALGYKIRAIGTNPRAALFKGIQPKRILVLTLALSGGIAGLAGAIELFGFRHRLRPDISPGYGWTGMLIAMLAARDPLIVVPAAIFFGALLNGSRRMQVSTGVPVSLIYVIQAVILLFLLGSQVIARYQIKRVSSGK
jgi:ABC-type uncharacterized transport system permease subunit